MPVGLRSGPRANGANPALRAVSSDAVLSAATAMFAIVMPARSSASRRSRTISLCQPARR